MSVNTMLISSIHSLLYAYPNQPKLAFQQDRDELCLLAAINIMVETFPTAAVTFYVILKNKAQYRNNDAIIKKKRMPQLAQINSK